MRYLWFLPLVFLIGCSSTPPQTKKEIYKLVSLRNKDVPSGSFVLASGSIGEKTRYKFFCSRVREDGTTELLHFDESPNDICVILTDNAPPSYTVKYILTKYINNPPRWEEASMWYSDSYGKPVLCVPESAIVQSIELKP